MFFAYLGGLHACQACICVERCLQVPGSPLLLYCPRPHRSRSGSIYACQAPIGPLRTTVYPLKKQAFTISNSWFPFCTLKCYNSSVEPTSKVPLRYEIDAMTKNLDIISAAVSLIIKAALLAARFSGRVRKRSLKRLAAMDMDTKDKEIIFLRDKVDQLKMQVSILQKGIKKRQSFWQS